MIGVRKMETKNKVIVFLYMLMRDNLTCGTVEKIVRSCENIPKDGYILSNDCLAMYSDDLKKRLENGNNHKD